MIQKDMVERSEINTLEFQGRIAAAKTVKELLTLDEEISGLMSSSDVETLLSSIFLIANDKDREGEWLNKLLIIATPFKDLFSLINTKLFHLIKDTDTLVAVLQTMNDEAMRSRLLWKLDNSRHLSF